MESSILFQVSFSGRRWADTGADTEGHVEVSNEMAEVTWGRSWRAGEISSQKEAAGGVTKVNRCQWGRWGGFQQLSQTGSR